MDYTELLVVVSNQGEVVVGSGIEVVRFSQESCNSQLHGRREKEVGAIKRTQHNSWIRLLKVTR